MTVPISVVPDTAKYDFKFPPEIEYDNTGFVGTRYCEICLYVSLKKLIMVPLSAVAGIAKHRGTCFAVMNDDGTDFDGGRYCKIC